MRVVYTKHFMTGPLAGCQAKGQDCRFADRVSALRWRERLLETTDGKDFVREAITGDKFYASHVEVVD